MGLDGFMGGQYQSNLTTLGIYKRQWLGSFGYMDFNIVGKAQWSKVPFTMLIQPPVNLSLRAGGNHQHDEGLGVPERPPAVLVSSLGYERQAAQPHSAHQEAEVA